PTSVQTLALTYSLHGLTATDVILGLGGAGLFLWAGWRLRSMHEFGSMGPWLIVSLIVAAFSHLHYMLLPTIFTNRLATWTLQRRWDSMDEEQRISIVEQIERGTVQLRDLAEESVTVLRLDTEPFDLVRRSELAMEIERDAAGMVDELHGRLKVYVDDGAER